MRRAVVIIAATVFQAVWIARIDFRGGVPNLVLACIVVLALDLRSGQAAGLGALGGFLQDLLGSGGVARTIASGFAAFAAATVSERFSLDSPFFVAGITAAASLISDAIFWCARGIGGYPPGLEFTHFHMALWNMLLTSACSIPVWFLFRRRGTASFR